MPLNTNQPLATNRLDVACLDVVVIKSARTAPVEVTLQLVGILNVFLY